MVAEYLKSKTDGKLELRTRYILEIFIPATSICALLGVTGWISQQAIAVIVNHGDDEDVNVIFLFGYAAGNMLIDIGSSLLFYYRRNEVFHTLEFKTLSLTHHGDDTDDKSNYNFDDIENSIVRRKSLTKPKTTNLNMISAFTHVGSDTMRTLSVFAAAILATAFNFSSSLCDAWAAVVVSITIVLFVLPLIKQIFDRLRDLRNESNNEQS